MSKESRSEVISVGLDPRRSSRVFSKLGSLPVFGIILFVFATSFPLFEVTTEVNLGVHMLQHVIIAISGVCIGYFLLKSGRLDKIRSTRTGLMGFLGISASLILWHIPYFWDTAVQNLYIHVIEHFCFLAVGILIGATIPMLPDNYKMFVLVLAISAHMFYGFALYLVGTPIYPLYPLSQQQILGIALFAPSPVYFVGYLFLVLTRENKRLIAMESGQTKTLTRKSGKLGRWFFSFLSIAMIGALVIYFGFTGAIILQSSVQSSPQVSIIYIEESPVSWQYSPQVISVVIGVNNTVDWVSHSFTYDTVNSANNLFSSGPIPPGGRFSITFSQPGTYDFYCQYHLWMKGTVIVKSS